ncbi:hypothetical protein [Chitinivorax sp. B]|uniref:hypothetical protein n=1 Tax=Chitinivorax sp. B TaxID=2502235 RepID=UPI0010F781A2|nr:hypothetical protein [Chitinivorax sp. B]
MKKNISVGMVIGIPVSGGSVVGKVLYVSEYFKDLILLGVCKILTERDVMPQILPDEFDLYLYTTQDPIRKGKWAELGFDALRESQKGKALRIVADEVWLDDECIRKVSAEDRVELPKMLALGSILVEKKAAKLVGLV